MIPSYILSKSYFDDSSSTLSDQEDEEEEKIWIRAINPANQGDAMEKKNKEQDTIELNRVYLV